MVNNIITPLTEKNNCSSTVQPFTTVHPMKLFNVKLYILCVKKPQYQQCLRSTISKLDVSRRIGLMNRFAQKGTRHTRPHQPVQTVAVSKKSLLQMHTHRFRFRPHPRCAQPQRTCARGDCVWIRTLSLVNLDCM